MFCVYCGIAYDLYGMQYIQGLTKEWISINGQKFPKTILGTVQATFFVAFSLSFVLE